MHKANKCTVGDCKTRLNCLTETIVRILLTVIFAHGNQSVKYVTIKDAYQGKLLPIYVYAISEFPL